MKVTVLFFGVLREVSGKQSAEIENVKTVSQLKSKLTEQFPSISKYKFQVSVNRVICEDTTLLSNHDEVALLPPFAGG